MEMSELPLVVGCTLLRGRPLAGPSLGFMVATSAESVATVGRKTMTSPLLKVRQWTGRRRKAQDTEENWLRDTEGARDLEASEAISYRILFCCWVVLPATLVVH